MERLLDTVKLTLIHLLLEGNILHETYKQPITENQR